MQQTCAESHNGRIRSTDLIWDLDNTKLFILFKNWVIKLIENAM